MAKKNTNITNEQVEEGTSATAEVVPNETVSEVKAEKNSTKPNKQEKVAKMSKQNTKKKEKKSRGIGKFFKEMFSELKKVTWPTFGEVVKKTSIVIAVVLVFGVVLFGFDRLLSLLFNTLVSAF